MVDKENSEFCLQSLKHYNEGRLIFKWYNVEDWEDFADIEQDFKEYVKKEAKEKEEIEEFMFCDYSNFPNMGEYPNHEEVNELIGEINKAEYPKEAIIEFYDNFGQIEGFEDSYQGEWDTELDFTYNLIDDCYNIEEMMGSLSSYFDYDSFSRDLFMTDYIYLNGFVFSNNW